MFLVKEQLPDFSNWIPTFLFALALLPARELLAEEAK